MRELSSNVSRRLQLAPDRALVIDLTPHKTCRIL